MRVWAPLVRAKAKVAWGVDPSVAVANVTGLPPASSSMVTVPEGTPLAVYTVATMLVSEQVPDAEDWVVAEVAIVVDVVTPSAFAETTDSTGIPSAILSPATNSSRSPRQKMPLTCTCSKDQKSCIAHLPQRKTYCIRRDGTEAIADPIFRRQAEQNRVAGWGIPGSQGRGRRNAVFPGRTDGYFRSTVTLLLEKVPKSR